MIKTINLYSNENNPVDVFSLVVLQGVDFTRFKYLYALENVLYNDKLYAYKDKSMERFTLPNWFVMA